METDNGKSHTDVEQSIKWSWIPAEIGISWIYDPQQRLRRVKKNRLFVGVTGAQGVGKSTFAANLRMQLEQLIDVPIYLIDGLGEKLKNKNIPFGSAATPDSIAAAYSIHIQRELDAPSGIIVLDRCIIDAIAYVRSLRVTSSQQTELFEVITRCRAADLDLLVHLQMTHPSHSQQQTTKAPNSERKLELRSSKP